MKLLLQYFFNLIIFLILSFQGLSQYNLRGTLNNRQVDSIFRLQQKPQCAKTGNARNKKALFSFTAASASSVLTRNFSTKSQAVKTEGCVDTSSRFFLKQDSTQFYVKNYIRANDGNLLLCGEYEKFAGNVFTYKGFFMKCDEKGNIFWTKVYDSLNHVNTSYLNYYRILELKDGSFLLAGTTPNSVTQNEDLILTKTGKSGDLVWSKVFKSRLWGHGSGSTDFYYVQQMIQDFETENVFLTGPHWEEGRSIIQLNPQNGEINWSKLYQPPYRGYFDIPSGLDIQGKELLVFGKFLTSFGNFISVYKLDKITGDTIQSKFFSYNNNEYGKLGFFSLSPLSKLANGNYILSGSQYGYYKFGPDDTADLYHAGFIQLNSNLDFVNAFSFRNNVESNSFNTKITIFPDGSGLFTMLKFKSAYNSKVYYTHFKNATILKQRVKDYDAEGIPVESSSLMLKDGGSLTIKLLGDSTGETSKIEFLKLHITDTSSKCLGVDDHSTYMDTFFLKEVAGNIDSIGVNVFQENPNKTLTAENTTLQYVPGCEQKSFCNSFSLSSSAQNICLGDALLLTVHKNKECRAPVFFDFDSSRLQSIEQVNDSVYNFKFASSWQGTIRAFSYGCSLLTDSLAIRVLNSPPVLNLGPDRVLCPGNSIILNAGANYASYLWQDGSSDSLLTITQTGTYFISTTNACGGTFYDTLLVTHHPPIPFDIGPDLVKCNADSVTITAPAGFISYEWRPEYHISSDTSRSVIVSPATTTLYKVKAEKSPGCFAYDSVKVTVHISPKIDLGSDTSICFGDSLMLNAGGRFSEYLWSTGSDEKIVTVKKAGTYSVTAITSDNCQSTDTINLINVFENPVVTLNKNSSLCEGSIRQLNAGNFKSYLWNTGETTPTIKVNKTGIYYVAVKDMHNCSGHDTTEISTILSLPQKFLPADTSICSYSTLQLSPVKNFYNYLWSSRATSKSIIATQPGTYWLQVTDNNNCIGKDSVIVHFKDCMAGFFIPNAFTPNNDGKNDLFRPFLFGQVLSYEFIIYNRFGETVFKTNKLTDGWNGNYKSGQQNSNTFLWVCKYRLRGDNEKVEKGSVILLR